MPLETLASLSVTIPITVNSSVEVHEPLPAGHPIFSLVGQVSSEFARLEHTLDTAIWALAELEPPLGACLTAQIIGVRPRCLTIIALLSHRGFKSDKVKKIRKFMEKTSSLSDDRNRLVHDPWFLDKIVSTPKQLRTMPKKAIILWLSASFGGICQRRYFEDTAIYFFGATASRSDLSRTSSICRPARLMASPDQASGFRSARIVGSSSETVGWMWTARCMTV